MQVVLLERIEKLGQMGEVVSVKDGFARNFLLPQNKALRATPKNMEAFEAQRAQLEARNLELRKDAAAVGEKMEGTRVVIVRQASEADQLYGSVSARDIAEALTEEGYTVDKSQVVLDRPIKMIGLIDVRVSLHPEVSIGVQVNVARSEEEAEAQATASEEAIMAEAQAVFESDELAQVAVDELVQGEEDASDDAVTDEAAPDDSEAASEDAAEGDAESDESKA